jgi:putative ABC transport system permease protein
MWKDIRYAIQMLAKSPALTAIVVTALALGIGANTAIFSVVHTVLLRPLSYRDPGRLVVIHETNEKRGRTRGPVSPADFMDWRDQTTVFEQIAAMGYGRGIYREADEPEEVEGSRVTASFFPLLGVEPLLGRTIEPEDDNPDSQPVIVVSHRFWQTHLASDPNAIGKPLRLDARIYTLIGVMPPRFHFPSEETEFWSPLGLTSRSYVSKRGWFILRAIGRLKQSATLEQAQSELDTIAARLRQEYPKSHRNKGVWIVPLHEEIVGEVRTTVLILFGAVGCVLLIACANVANLLLARASERRKEIAMRIALGASRVRIVRHLLTESLLVAILGGALGLLLAFWAVDAVVVFNPINLPRVDEIGINSTVLAFTFLLCIVTVVLFGLSPALQSSRPDLNEVLKEGAGTQLASGLRGSRSRNVLVVSQIGLAVVLLIGAGLLIKSFWLRVNVDLGFRPENMLTVQLPGYASKSLSPLLDRIRRLPGVASAAAATAFPHKRPGESGSFDIEGRPNREPKQEMTGGAGLIVVTPEYFETTRIALRKGRFIREGDGAGAPQVAVINETLARRYFPGENPIGERIRSFGATNPWRQIVGVVGNVKGFGVDGDPMPTIYASYQQQYWGNPVYLVVRTALPPHSLAVPVRKEIRGYAKHMPITKISTEEDLLSDSVALPRFYMLLLGGFALLALILAVIGIYGVINYSVARRTHEIGIRIALGAERGDVLAMVMKQASALTIVGLIIGAAGAFAVTRVLSSLLFRVTPTDEITFVSAAILLMAVALLASYIPARRATKVDPIVALRHE